MGQTASNTSKEQRAEKEKIKFQKVYKQIENINQLQEKVWNESRDVVDYKTFNRMMQFGETAKYQLSKGGATLTKADLIAICICLDPNYKKQIGLLEQYTVNDLNTMIRCIIYDVPIVGLNSTQIGY